MVAEYETLLSLFNVLMYKQLVAKNETFFSTLKNLFILDLQLRLGASVEAKERYCSSLRHSNICNTILYPPSSRKCVPKSIHISDIWRCIHVSNYWSNNILNDIP